MISVDEARARILSGLKPVPAEIVALAEAWGRVTAEPVIARLTQPPADVSAMDGYALRAADGVEGAVLRVIGSAPAGHPFAGTVGAGEAVRLFTGSVVPGGADGILLQEDATRDGETVRVNETVRAGRHVRRAGQDFSAGDAVVPAGRRITARDIGLAAAANHPWLTVRRRPCIGILATGDEIALPGEPIPPGGIVSSNSHALAALVRTTGGAPTVLPVARDDRAAIGAVADAVAGMDMLVTTGGASVGDHDLVIAALKERGLEVDFWRIAMRPGKPLVFGRLGASAGIGVAGQSGFRAGLFRPVPAPGSVRPVRIATRATARGAGGAGSASPPERSARRPPAFHAASPARWWAGGDALPGAGLLNAATVGTGGWAGVASPACPSARGWRNSGGDPLEFVGDLIGFA